jgi:hypothetical protein
MFNFKINSRPHRNLRSREIFSISRHSLSLEMLEARILLAVNAIVAENQLPGTPDTVWNVDGAGDSSIQGFATDISVDQGQTVSFKIKDTNTAPYRVDIYRMGYYSGLGARLVSTIPSSQTLRQVQPNPLKNNAIGLVDAGNWAVSASWAVPSNATSGIYFARMTREDTGGASSSGMMTVVRISFSRPPTRPGKLTTHGAEIACTRQPIPYRPVGPSRSAIIAL